TETLAGQTGLISNLQSLITKIFRCLYRRCPPLPIPNREVKPARADGTAVKCGRVGRCQILSGIAFVETQGLSCFYTCCVSLMQMRQCETPSKSVNHTKTQPAHYQYNS